MMEAVIDPAQYSSKGFAACFFAAANSVFLISESFSMSLAIIPSSFKISLQFRHPRGEWRSEMKFFVFHGLLVIGFHPCGALVATARRLSACPTYRAIYAGAPSCRAGFDPLNFLRL